MTRAFLPLAWLLALAIPVLSAAEPQRPRLKIMGWNIWRAGVKKEETGKPHQVTALIKREPELCGLKSRNRPVEPQKNSRH